MRMPKKAYLALFVIGTLAPYAVFVPWVLENGLDIPLFVTQALENRISAFFTLDVVISAVVLLAAAWSTLRPREKAWVTVCCLGVGVSSALPLMLYFQTDET